MRLPWQVIYHTDQVTLNMSQTCFFVGVSQLVMGSEHNQNPGCLHWSEYFWIGIK